MNYEQYKKVHEILENFRYKSSLDGTDIQILEDEKCICVTFKLAKEVTQQTED